MAEKKTALIEGNNISVNPKKSNDVKRSSRIKDVNDAIHFGSRAIRQSTKQKTNDADIAHKKAASLAYKARVKFRPSPRHQFSQKELLIDALKTEV